MEEDEENPIFPSISLAAKIPDEVPEKFICTDHQSLLKKGNEILAEIEASSSAAGTHFNCPQVSYGFGIEPLYEPEVKPEPVYTNIMLPPSSVDHND